MPDEMQPCAKCGAESRRAAKSSDRLCVQCAGTDEIVDDLHVTVKQTSALGVFTSEDVRRVVERIMGGGETQDRCLFEVENPEKFRVLEYDSPWGQRRDVTDQFLKRSILHPIFQTVLAALDLHENFSLTNEYFAKFGFKLEDVEEFCIEHNLRMTRFAWAMDIVFSRPRDYSGYEFQVHERSSCQKSN